MGVIFSCFYIILFKKVNIVGVFFVDFLVYYYVFKGEGLYKLDDEFIC